MQIIFTHFYELREDKLLQNFGSNDVYILVLINITNAKIPQNSDE